jgi:uncharacterized damage-inducible protein DinB
VNKKDILLLYKYNQWATAKILSAASNLTTEQFLAPASFHMAACGEHWSMLCFQSGFGA